MTTSSSVPNRLEYTELDTSAWKLGPVLIGGGCFGLLFVFLLRPRGASGEDSDGEKLLLTLLGAGTFTATIGIGILEILSQQVTCWFDGETRTCGASWHNARSLKRQESWSWDAIQSIELIEITGMDDPDHGSLRITVPGKGGSERLSLVDIKMEEVPSVVAYFRTHFPEKFVFEPIATSPPLPSPPLVTATIRKRIPPDSKNFEQKPDDA